MSRVFDYIPKYHFTDEERRKTLEAGPQPGEMWELIQDRYKDNWNQVMTRYCPERPVEEITPQWCMALAEEAKQCSGHDPIRLEIHPDKNHQVVFLPKEGCWRLFTASGFNNWAPVKEIKGSDVCEDSELLRRRGVHPYMANLDGDSNGALLDIPFPVNGELQDDLFLNGWGRLIPKAARLKASALFEEISARRADGEVIYPPQDMIFRALNLTPPEKVRVVIIGQDPYHGPNEACGLAFSVQPDVKVPPSLRNIFKVLQNDFGWSDDKMPKSGDLTAWAERGVLLLNTVLTVKADTPMSHAKLGWQDVTGAIIEACAALPQPIVFLLWGAEAVIFSTRKNVVETNTKHIIISSHPSPLAANRSSARLPAFMKSHPFLEANGWLVSHGSAPINWGLR